MTGIRWTEVQNTHTKQKDFLHECQFLCSPEKIFWDMLRAVVLVSYSILNK